MISTLITIFIILVLIGMNGLFVAAEFAIVTASKPKISQMADQGSKTAQELLQILSVPEMQNRYVTTAQVGITIASLGLGMYGEHAIAEWFLVPLEHLGSLSEPLAHSIALVLAVSFLTYLHVVLGEMIPKSLALQSASTTVLALYQPLKITDKIFYPLVYFLNHVSLFVVKLLNLHPEEESTRLFTPEDLEFIVEESSEIGLLEKSDLLFIENILDLEERIAGHIMTPRNRINAIQLETDYDQTIEIICESNKTRFPVYDNSLDDIRGIIHVKDIARWQTENGQGQINLAELLRPVIYIPQALTLDHLLKKFRDENIQFAVVLDEYGGTAGIITLEDLVEEVVGEILDEFDIEDLPIEEITPTEIRVRGDVILGELEQHYNIKFEDTIAANSIGGYIMSLLGTIPKPNDKITVDGHTIVVESVESRAVSSVIIHINPPQEE